MIIAQRAEADRMAASVRAYEALVQALRIRIARLKKQKFGASSEKIEREIDQLQLALEDLEVAIAAAAEPPEPDPPAAATRRAAPRRRGKPRITGPLARERIVLDPGERCRYQPMMLGARVSAASASSTASGASKRKRRAASVSFTISLVGCIFGHSV